MTPELYAKLWNAVFWDAMGWKTWIETKGKRGNKPPKEWIREEAEQAAEIDEALARGAGQ